MTHPEKNVLTPIAPVLEKSHKFLGSNIISLNKIGEMFQFTQDKPVDKLTNIDTSLIRGEYKLAIYYRYALTSMRFHVSIHDMHKTHLHQLDNTHKTYIKRWKSIPKQGVSDMGIFHPYLLGTKTPWAIYLLSHASNYISICSKGDINVQKTLNSSLNHDSKWKTQPQQSRNVTKYTKKY